MNPDLLNLSILEVQEIYLDESIYSRTSNSKAKSKEDDYSKAFTKDILINFLIDPKYEDLFELNKRTHQNIYMSILDNIIKKHSYFKSKNVIYGEISKSMKRIYTDRNFSINFMNNITYDRIKNGFSTEEILNEISFIYNTKRTLEFYSNKSIKDLIKRSTKVNREQVPDRMLKSIYFDYKNLKEETFLEKDFNTIRFLIDGPQQLRRPLDSDYGHYRYIPIQCKDYCQKIFSDFYENLINHAPYQELITNMKPYEVNSFVSELKLHFLKNCIFAHNINEISYHPLKYMTKYCKHSNCIHKQCAFAHLDKKEELILIFNIKQFEEIRRDLTGFIKQQNSLTKYDRYFYNPGDLVNAEDKEANFEKSDKFDNILNSNNQLLFTLKVYECKKKDLCENIKNCPFYHSTLERRRSPEIFPIKNNKPCKKVYVENKWKNPKLCEAGDSCNYFHTRNELLYDSRNYKKIYECYIEKNKGVCEFYKLCPYKHIIDIDVGALYLPKIEKATILEMVKVYLSYYNESKKIKRKIQKNNLVCPNCEDFIKDQMVVFKCGHNCCYKCVKVMKNCSLLCLKILGNSLEIDKDYYVFDFRKNISIKTENAFEFSKEDENLDFYDLKNKYEYKANERDDESWLKFN